MIFKGGFGLGLGAVALIFRGQGGFSKLEVGLVGRTWAKTPNPTNIQRSQVTTRSEETKIRFSSQFALPSLA